MSQSFEGFADIEIDTHAHAIAHGVAPRNALTTQASVAGPQASFPELPMTEADLLRALDKATASIMRLAGKLRSISGDEHDAYADEQSIEQQRALAHALICRLLTMPASTVQH